MNINVTVGVTPELAKLLEGLSQLGKFAAAAQVDSAPLSPSQPVQEPAQQVVQPQQPAGVPTAAPAPVAPQPEPQQQSAPVQSAVPTSETTYTMDQLAVAATQLMDQGKRDALLQLLSSFGVQALTALPKEQYGAFATKLREQGAKI
ncbi:hypothetical protein J2S74_002284 [Evansella vedderi]|uniref:Uncharacterized protein n=1 Tax=Evansella vedderi TaxID=38282 RepID=A0ABT9ZUI5_9BACI|nr:hypothetical protein [Evansella vedderi]MDQ0254902.1 hypothetical protein [Evansella vedderi]